MRRRGYTLLEVCIAVSLAVILLGGVLSLVISGSRLFSSGVGASRGPEASLIILDEIENDLLQCLQLPGDPRPPVTKFEKSLSFYRPGTLHSQDGQVELVGKRVTWNLRSGSEEGLFLAIRNGEPVSSFPILGWDFEILEPSQEDKRPGWFVAIRIHFPAESKVSKDFQVARLVFLGQPSSNYLHYPAHGKSLIPGIVKLVGPP